MGLADQIEKLNVFSWNMWCHTNCRSHIHIYTLTTCLPLRPSTERMREKRNNQSQPRFFPSACAHHRFQASDGVCILLLQRDSQAVTCRFEYGGRRRSDIVAYQRKAWNFWPDLYHVRAETSGGGPPPLCAGKGSVHKSVLTSVHLYFVQIN